MSFAYRLLWRSLFIVSLFVALWFFSWAVLWEMVRWQKGLLESFVAAKWDWIGLVLSCWCVVVCSVLDDLASSTKDEQA